MNIHVVRFSAFGDCVLLCPLLARFKETGHAVTVITKSAFAPLFAAATGVDRIVAYDPATGIGGLRRLAAAARSGDGMLIDAHNTVRSRILCKLMGGADARIEKYYRERVLHIWFKTEAEVPSMLERYGALAAAVGDTAQLAPGGIAIPTDARERAESRLASDDRDCVAVAPGSRWPMKRWGAEHFTTLCERIARRGYRLVLLGDEGDRDVTRPIAQRVGDGCIDVTGETDVITAGAYIERCAAFVGNDSGLMHLAEALGVPVVALFGPTVRLFGYYPALAGSRTVERSLPCRPCSRNGSLPCPKGTQECLADIPVDAVERAFTDLVANVEQRRYVLT